MLGLHREHRPHDRRRRHGARRVRRHANTFQEGIRFPPVKIYREDEEVEAIFKILISNVRTPKHSYGDMKAMIGSLYLAERRIDELVTRYGADTFKQAARTSRSSPSGSCGPRSPRGPTASTRPRA